MEAHVGGECPVVQRPLEAVVDQEGQVLDGVAGQELEEDLLARPVLGPVEAVDRAPAEEQVGEGGAGTARVRRMRDSSYSSSAPSSPRTTRVRRPSSRARNASS
ncbi:hypothetical protein L2K70_07290 [Nocardioides KLBMP 9356]|uniref:Uncharacterized protein n=1 Tax=Nocardioides potassii TaxID=2911371 RepID=A0ABS9HAZ3_9ACTN|nr:hypothetical protein [Nocardioides potassii]MCF6377404.1 hypothetical protein [Nocardioides potassii]